MSKTKHRAPSHLIVGFGEVGESLYEVLRKKYAVSVRDKEKGPEGRFDVLHIAYPWSSFFVRDARAYIKQYRPSLIVIHSTVPVGTTRKISSRAVHSPIRGVHPNLAKGIKVFVKYFGGSNAKRAAMIFSYLGVPTHVFSKPETTELMKILDTTYYGWNIVFAKEANKICKRLGLSFDEVYTHANFTYNEAYTKLGMSRVARPVLRYVRGEIGGHCVIPNTHLLNSWITQTLRNRNKRYKQEN